MYADKEKNTGAIGSVAYSLLGETTPSTFYDSITPEIMADGFLSRFVVIEYTGDRPNRNKARVAPSDELVSRLANIVAQASQRQKTTPHQQVQHSPESQVMFDLFSDECDRNINGTHDEARRQAWNRGHLNALTIASLLAVGDNHINPVIQSVHADWAIELITRNIAAYEKRLSSGDVGDGDDVLQKKVMQIAHRVLKGELKDTNPKIYKDGVVTRRVVQTNTSGLAAFKNHPLRATKALDATIATLLANGNLMKIDNHEAIEKYDSHGDCYRVLSLD
jgi:hypothetical protein